MGPVVVIVAGDATAKRSTGSVMGEDTVIGLLLHDRRCQDNHLERLLFLADPYPPRSELPPFCARRGQSPTGPGPAASLSPIASPVELAGDPLVRAGLTLNIV